jgi:putative ABC transport system permease protein
VIFILKLAFRNAFRHILRTLLTILSVTIALLAFGLLQTVVNAWYTLPEASSANRLVTRNSISLIFSLPLSYRDRIRKIEGVQRTSYGNWFGGIYREAKNFFPNIAVEPESYLALYPEFLLPEDQKKNFFHNRKACIAGYKTASIYGWEIGDIITLKGTIFPGNWEFTLAGIYRGKGKATDESQFFFHWDYLNETLKKTSPRQADQVGFYVIGITDADSAAKVATAVDDTFKNSLAQTLTETERAFQLGFITMSEAILTAIHLISLVIIIIMMAVVTNTMSMTFRERIHEYATLKTLGFSPWLIFWMIFCESLTITMTGCAIGMALTFPVVKSFGMSSNLYLPAFRVDHGIFSLYLMASLLVGFTASLLPAWRAARITIAEGLRRIG